MLLLIDEMQTFGGNERNRKKVSYSLSYLWSIGKEGLRYEVYENAWLWERLYLY